MTKIQRYSSYTFSAFLTAHITNTSIIPLITQSVGASENYLLLTRPYYQSPVFEPLIIFAPLTLHIASGIALRLTRRRQAVNWYGAESKAERRNLAWPKLSGTSLLGYLFFPAVAAHIYVNRGLPVLVEGGSSGVGLSYISHGFARHPAVAYTAYTALLGLGVSHFVWGWSRWLGWHPDKATGVNGDERQQIRKRRWYSINGVALATIILWAAGGLGIIARGGAAFGWKGKNYDKLFHHIPIIGHWLAP